MKKIVLTAAAGAAMLFGSYEVSSRFFFAMDPYEVVRKLQGLRLAVELFRQETGHNPRDIGEVVGRGDLEGVPSLKLKGHRASSKVRNAADMKVMDTGSWAYVNAPESPYFGSVFIDCSHLDEKGRVWSGF